MGRVDSLRKMFFYLCIALLSANISVEAKSIFVGQAYSQKSIQQAILHANDHDTVFVEGGIYKEGNVVVDKPIVLIGHQQATIDGQKRFEVLSIKSDSVTISGFTIQHSGLATLEDPGGIKVYDGRFVVIENNILEDNFFGIYIQFGKNCIVKNNHIRAYGKEEQEIGNGIHCWKSDSMQIVGNTISGHRDGIYFEFVTNSIIWRNISEKNIRYGLHFMFSNDDAYITNLFRANGAGVAVMFSKKVTMMNNTFQDNWGDACYGILLKEISDAYISGNHFDRNTAALYLEGASRMLIEKNNFQGNGWAMRVQASCMDNTIQDNNFMDNTFDMSTNGALVLNVFKHNYWDKYDGFDLNRDKVGDIPFHPLSLFSVIVERNPPAMLLFRSFIVTLLDKSERILPSLTPDNFKDTEPSMHPIDL